MFYRIDKENNIIDSAEFKYADDCLETDKNIVRSFNGKLVFEEETLTDNYRLEKEKMNLQIENNNKISELDNWFKTDYLKYEQMFTRREKLGIADVIEDEFRNRVGENAYHNLIELYEEAELVAEEIRELRKTV